MQSGAGAARQMLEKGQLADEESSTHTLVRDRVQALHDWADFTTDPLCEQFHDMRLFLANLLVGIFNLLALSFFAAHKAGCRPGP